MSTTRVRLPRKRLQAIRRRIRRRPPVFHVTPPCLHWYHDEDACA